MTMEIMKIKLCDIIVNPHNPRDKNTYTKESLRSLINSLASIGQLTPCILDENNMLLSGHRRFYAAKLLNWEELKCQIKTGLSNFEKSAILISENMTQLKFNLWAHRDAINRIYWEEFLEEYEPKSQNDNGYSTFAKKLGSTPSNIRRIIESQNPRNKEYSDKLRKEGFPACVLDAIMSAPEDIRGYLTNHILQHKKKTKGMKATTIKQLIDSEKRKHIVETGCVTSMLSRHYVDKTMSLANELTLILAKKMRPEDLEKMKELFEKQLLPFYKKIS